MWVRPLVDADATCGGKAAGLARLIAAGLPVPDGFVVEDHAFRAVVGSLEPQRDAIGHALAHAATQLAGDTALPADLVDDVQRRADTLGAHVVVRSSASLEDAATGSAAGVFASITNVAPRDVWPAIRAVWTGALTPLAAAYARDRDIALGVIVQRFIVGERIVVYTRAPGDPSKLVVQRGAHVRDFARDDVHPILALALRAEHAIGAPATGADVELVEDRTGELWVVQARPIVPAPPPSRTPPPPALLAALVADGRRWTWDVTHNPDPLSPAQAGLVERVDRAAVAPWSLRVCAGYLYSAPRIALPDVAITDRADFEARAAVIEADFARILDGDAASVDDAIARYIAFYERWAMALVPLIAAARRRAGDVEPAEIIGARTSSVEAVILAAARGVLDEESAITQLAPFAPTWDVAVPTFGEQPEIVRAAIVRARNLANILDEKIDPTRNIAITRDTKIDRDLARAAADLAERDDRWFAKAQQLVRCTLLAKAATTGIASEDICWLSLDNLDLGPEDAHRRASAARAANERASAWAMPVVIADGHGREDTRAVLHGFGSDARVSGRVVRYASLASAIAVGRGDVIVTRAITPALAVFVIGCAAIISETGGPLDHGAAIARELGIPFVVGCRDAWSLLRDGMLVTIDKDVVIV